MDVYRAIKTMRSIRQFTQENVRDETITKILEAGRWAGSAKNTQPCQFIGEKLHSQLLS
jgi:nitroreductase